MATTTSYLVRNNVNNYPCDHVTTYESTPDVQQSNQYLIKNNDWFPFTISLYYIGNIY